jgi:hypothetical protein
MAATNSSGIKGTLLTQLNTQVLPLSGALVPFEFGGWPLLECGGVARTKRETLTGAAYS